MRRSVLSFIVMSLLVGCSPAPKQSLPIDSAPTVAPPLVVKELVFAGANGPRIDSTFARGERIICAFSIAQFVHLNRRVDVAADATLTDAQGKRWLTLKDLSVLQDQLTTAHPGEIRSALQFNLPTTITPGKLVLTITAHDRLGKRHGSASSQLTLKALPPYNPPPSQTPPQQQVASVSLHDNAGLPRRSFLLGEQVDARLVATTTSTQKQIDLALAGPDGIYFAQKNTATIAQSQTTPQTTTIEIPFNLPSVATTGTYRLVIRIIDQFDQLSRRQAVIEYPFMVSGNTAPPLTKLTIDRLEVRHRADSPRLKGDTFSAGRSYLLTVWVGGMKLGTPQKLTFQTQLQLHLRLRTTSGAIAYEQQNASHIDKTDHFRPLRAIFEVPWTTPNLPAGVYDLEIQVENQVDDQVSQLLRRVEINRSR